MFYWISRCGRRRRADISTPRREFQSLFYWISRCGVGPRHRRARRLRGFNPCSIGLAVAASKGTQKSAGYRHSFNPCSIGLAVAAGDPAAADECDDMFQSLFYWISRCGIGAGGGDGDVDLFQSLFYWISRCGRSITSAPMRAATCFNPCSIGLAVAARPTLQLLQGARVSILVLLD